MMPREDIVRLLIKFGKSELDDTPAAEAAILIGALDRPALALTRYHRHFEKLAEKVGRYARIEDGPVPVQDMAEALRQVLARHLGYGGAEFSAEEDCYDLSRVIDSRTGSGEALAILYHETARRLGWVAEIVEVPGRILIRLSSLGERVIIDPLGSGQPLEAADIRAIVKAFGGNEAELTPGGMEVLDGKSALLRLLAAKKAYLLRQKRLDDAAEVLDCALLLAPDEASLWRESGLLNARLDRIRDAIAALEEYLRLDEGDGSRYHTTILLQELRGRLT